uniref:Uncharacterized protein n=1 Tax=Salarias fasciatus TaxID=181472 RepID=A0A672I8P7_SALFA
STCLRPITQLTSAVSDQVYSVNQQHQRSCHRHGGQGGVKLCQQVSETKERKLITSYCTVLDINNCLPIFEAETGIEQKKS